MFNENKVMVRICLAFIVAGILCSSAQAFVQTDGTEFVENGNPFYFAGANNYYLFYKPMANVEEVFDDAQDLGLNVIRTWGFCDGTCSDGNFMSFQSSPGVYNEATFQRFDQIIKEASDRNIKLIVPLVNNWDVFGGMCQYVEWCGLPDYSQCDADEPWPFGLPTQVHDDFYTDPCTKQLYKDYVSYFLNRVNSITGVAYKDDPTIFAWELANEPRARSDTSGATLNNWIGEMSAYIKSIDSSHMVTPGGDGGYLDKPSDPEWSWWYHGNEGQDFIGNHQWPGIDFSTFRYYPESGKFDDVDPALWIQEHVEDSHNIIGKPVIMEEFGSVANKVGNLSSFYSDLEADGANGDTFWLLADSSASGNDGYFVFCPENTEVCDIISTHADFMNSLNYECTINSDCDDNDPDTVDICLADHTCSHQSDSQCTVPVDGMNITNDTVFCQGDYYLPNAFFVIGGVVLDCGHSHIYGDSTGYGILAYDNSTIKNCIISDYKNGIRSSSVRNVSIINNVIYNITSNGIVFYPSSRNCTIRNNTIFTSGKGIYFWTGSWNSITDNHVYNNSDCGITLYKHSDINLVDSNNLHDNLYGICLYTVAEGNTVTNNLIDHNNMGIKISEGNFNDISDNTLTRNSYGVFMDEGYSNNLTRNAVFDSDEYGIYIYGRYNTVWDNDFINNNISAYEEKRYSAYGNNSWNLSTTGNNWSDFDQNPGYASIYIIEGDSLGIDYWPEGKQYVCEMPYDGMIVEGDTELCPGNYELSQGLIINSDNITLDCNGAVISGQGSGIGISAQGTYDLEHWKNETDSLKNISAVTENLTGFIDSIGFVENIEIKNCNIEGFENGLNLTAVKNAKIAGNTIHDNNAGIISGAYYGNISDNLVYDNQNGIVVGGINSTLDSNEVYGSRSSIIVIGIGNTISGNDAYDNTGTGITIAGFKNTVFSNNASSNSGNDGISLTFCSDSDVYGNIAENNARAGISIVEGSNNTVINNQMNYNRFGFGMQGLFSQGPSSGNLIANNTITQNTESGLALHDGVIWNIAKLLFGNNVKIKGHKVIDNTFTDNYLDNPLADLYVYGKEVRNNKITGNDFYGAGVLNPGNNKYCVGQVGNNYYNGAIEAPGDC